MAQLTIYPDRVILKFIKKEAALSQRSVSNWIINLIKEKMQHERK